MAAGLVLTTLAGAGADIYRSGNALFDLARLYEPALRLQVAQALDLGFQCRNGTALMADTTRSLENAAGHGVRFFSVAAEAVAGTPVSTVAGGGEGAFSMWLYEQRWNTPAAPVLARTDMRIRFNPTGGFYSVDGKGFAYNRLVHVLWHELHHLTTTQQHVRMDAPYDPGAPWVGAMIELGRAFPPTARDPGTGQQVILFKPNQWTSNTTMATASG